MSFGAGQDLCEILAPGVPEPLDHSSPVEQNSERQGPNVEPVEYGEFGVMDHRQLDPVAGEVFPGAFQVVRVLPDPINWNDFLKPDQASAAAQSAVSEDGREVDQGPLLSPQRGQGGRIFGVQPGEALRLE